MKLIDRIFNKLADKLYKYSSYCEIPKPPVIIREQKEIIKVVSAVNLSDKVPEEAIKKFLILEMKDQLEKFIKVEKISPNFEYPNSVGYRGEIKVVKE